MNTLASAKLYRFDQPSGYLKAVAFLPITFLEQKSILKIVYTFDSTCPLICLSVANSQVNLLLNLFKENPLKLRNFFCF